MAIGDAFNWLGTNAGRATTDMVGAGLDAYSNYQQGQQQLKQNANQTAAQLAFQNYWNSQNQNTNRAQGVLNADPLGADQLYAQRNALLSAILPNFKRSTPGDPAVAGAMGSGTGLTQAMTNLDPQMISSMFGPNATMAAIAQRHKEINNLDPKAPTPDLGSMYGQDASAPYVSQMQDWAQKAQNADAATRAQYDQQITDLINKMAQQEQSSGGSGFWHKLAKVAGVVGGVAAAAMTGGALSPLAGVALGAGSGALGSWGSGGNPLMGAVLGGGGAALGGALSGASNGVQGSINNVANKIYRGA